MGSAGDILLDIRGLAVHYGKALALDSISLHVDQGEIVSMVGANGAGKTTAIRTISGSKQPTSGEIWFGGRRIDKMPAYDVMRLGIVQVPAGRHNSFRRRGTPNLRDRRRFCQDRQGITESGSMPLKEDRQPPRTLNTGHV